MPSFKSDKLLYYFLAFLTIPVALLSQRIYEVPARQGLPFKHIELIHARYGLNVNEVDWIVQDHHGFTWFITDNGLNRFDCIDFRWHYRPTGPGASNGDVYREIVDDKNGVLHYMVWQQDSGIYGLIY